MPSETRAAAKIVLREAGQPRDDDEGAYQEMDPDCAHLLQAQIVALERDLDRAIVDLQRERVRFLEDWAVKRERRFDDLSAHLEILRGRQKRILAEAPEEVGGRSKRRKGAAAIRSQ